MIDGGAWIRPDGTMVRLEDDESHLQWIRKHTRMKDNREAFKHGWIRVRVEPGVSSTVEGYDSDVTKHIEFLSSSLPTELIVYVDDPGETSETRSGFRVESPDEMRELFQKVYLRRRIETREPDRQSVPVRSHLRRRVVDHLKNPPKACLCHRSKTVDRVRRGLIRRLE